MLGDWYQAKQIVTGKSLHEWVIQDINYPELDTFELHKIGSKVSCITLYPNILNTLGVSFRCELLSLRETFSSIYDTTDRGFMSWDRIEEAKIEINRFLIKYSKLKAFS